MCECCGGHNHNIEFKVSGMTCNHCAASVEKSVSSIKGVKSVNVNLNEGKVTVQFNPNDTKVEYIKAGIESVGFEVE